MLNEEIYFNQRCATISYFHILNSGWELETASFYNMTQNGLIRVGLWSIRYILTTTHTEKDKEGNEHEVQKRFV